MVDQHTIAGDGDGSLTAFIPIKMIFFMAISPPSRI
jgi:hypothetical protein